MLMLYRSTRALALAAVLMPVLTALASADQIPAAPSGSVETYRLGNQAFQVDNTGKGAVLCIWSIYDAVRLVGRECHPSQDAAFQVELEQSIARIDEFIIANSTRPVSKEQINALRAKGLEMLRLHGNICAGDTERFYQMFRSRGASALREQTTDLLSIPREPVMNPCL